VLDGPGLLPSTFTQGRRNRDVVAVRVRDESGNLIFDSAPGTSSPVSSKLALPFQYGALELETLVRPEEAGTIVIGGLPRSRLPFLLGLLALAAAMSVVAVAQIRRDTELARCVAISCRACRMSCELRLRRYVFIWRRYALGARRLLSNATGHWATSSVRQHGSATWSRTCCVSRDWGGGSSAGHFSGRIGRSSSHS
jgi:hypothetical protein